MDEVPSLICSCVDIFFPGASSFRAPGRRGGGGGGVEETPWMRSAPVGLAREKRVRAGLGGKGHAHHDVDGQGSRGHDGG